MPKVCQNSNYYLNLLLHGEILQEIQTWCADLLPSILFNFDILKIFWL